MLCSCKKKEEREDGRKQTKQKVAISSTGTVKHGDSYDPHYKLSGVWSLRGEKTDFDSEVQYHIIFYHGLLSTMIKPPT